MLVQELSRLTLFQDLSPAQLALIQPILEICDYSKDSVVFEQGDSAHFLYIVSRGEVVIRYKAYDGPVISVARVGKGGVFGWSSALGRATYSSGAVCTQDSEFYRISGKMLHRLCNEYPETGIIIVERLASVIDERLQSTHSQIMHFLTNGVDDPGMLPGSMAEEGQDGTKIF